MLLIRITSISKAIRGQLQSIFVDLNQWDCILSISLSVVFHEASICLFLYFDVAYLASSFDIFRRMD